MKNKSEIKKDSVEQISKLMDNLDNYGLFDVAEQLLKLRLVSDNFNELHYRKFVQSGALAGFHFDYDRGFYSIEIEVVRDVLLKTDSNYTVRIWVGTVDDGDLGAWSLHMDKESARSLCHRIANDVFKTLHVCPPLDEFNKLLMPFGLMLSSE